MVMLSILDQTLIFDGTTAAETLQESIALAQAAERLGYQRYWVVEYHSCDAVASASPEILIATIAAYTSHLRIGSGTVLLPHYSPLKVAENFRLLQALYPGRIDLGIGRNLGSVSQRCCQLLNPGGRAETIETYETKAQELIHFLDNTFPVDHPYRSIAAVPQGPGAPEVWMMSAHEEVAEVAGRQGIPFCLTHFVTSTQDVQVVAAYRRHFRAGHMEGPYVAVAVQICCAEDGEEASEMIQKYALLMMRRDREMQEQGISGAQLRYPSAQEVADYRYAEQDRAYLHKAAFPIIAGNPRQVKERLEEIVELYGADELIVSTVFPDARARLHSYTLLAEAF